MGGKLTKLKAIFLQDIKPLSNSVLYFSPCPRPHTCALS